MPAPKAADIGAELERLDAAIEVLKAEREPLAETAKTMLDRNIRICGPTKEYYLVESTTVELALAILSDKRVAKNVRDLLVKADGAKARKLQSEGLIALEVYKEFATEKPSIQLRSKRLKPATADRKAEVLEAAA